jgi:CRISPR-associated protein Cmr5
VAWLTTPRQRSHPAVRDGDLPGAAVWVVLPATIVMNGLGQALTIQLAKAKGGSKHPRRLLYNHVSGWLSQQMPELQVPGGELPRVIERLMDGNQDVYVRAQAETMSYLNWLKQFARAYLKEQEGQADE